MMRRFLICSLILALIYGLNAVLVPPALAYVEAPLSLGSVISQSTNIVVVQVEKVDKVNNRIIYRKIKDLKGKHPTNEIKHNIGKGGFHPREWQYPMEWAEPGKIAVFFHNGGASETCIGNYWYQAYAGGEWWGMSHGEPFMLRSYAGKVEKLINAVTAIQDNKEVIITAMVDGDKQNLHEKKAKIQRLKASLKLQDYNPKRDFAGWGAEDFRLIEGMAGFTHYSAINRVDPDAQAVSVVDFDGDGKLDLCLVGASKVALLQNGGDSFNEVMLPYTGGARAAVWADYNGDGKPDLLLATPKGPKLFTNLGGGQFRDDSHLLPPEPAYNLTAAAWIDYDGDGLPDILLGNGFHGLRLYRNKGKADGAKPADPKKPAITWQFEDVSEKVGLGPDGIGGNIKGDCIVVCDVDGDRRPDFLYGAGKGILVRNTGKGFEAVANSGIVFTPGKVGPVFGDFDGDGKPDLFVPQAKGCKLFRNLGNCKFEDVTDKAGDLAQLTCATSAAWGDFDNDGHLDLFVGCLHGPNRFFRNKGDGTFEDATTSIGLHQKIFNTQAIAAADLKKSGCLDLVFVNEGQDSAILVGCKKENAKRQAVTFKIGGADGVIGSEIAITNMNGKLLGKQLLSGGDGRGGQAAPWARFALLPGSYMAEVVYTSGVRRGVEFTVAALPVYREIDGQTQTLK
jgi:hypothetical protein